MQQSINKNINIVAVSWSIIHALFNINKNNANLHGSKPPHPHPAPHIAVPATLGAGAYPHWQQQHLHFLDMIYPPFLGHGFNVIYSSSFASTYSTSSSSVSLISVASKLKISLITSPATGQAPFLQQTRSIIAMIIIILPQPP